MLPTRPLPARSTQRPPPPSPPVPKCNALEKDGSNCPKNVFQHNVGHTLCVFHHKESQGLYKSYKKKHGKYKRITQIGADAGIDAKKNIETKISLGKEVLSLRNEVNRRFFSMSQNNRTHVHEILKLETEIHGLEKELEEWEASCKDSIESVIAQEISSQDAELEKGIPEAKTEVKMLQSLLNPTIPMSRLEHLPSDSPVVIAKSCMVELTKGIVRNLYSLVPSLDDSLPSALDEEAGNTRMKPELGTRDIVIRFVFREFLLYKADSSELSRATRTQTIDTFLQESFVSDIQQYIEFFKAFAEGRSDTHRLLRDAVCDFLLDSQPSSSTICILGGEIVTKDSLREMNAKGWDILFQYFHDIVAWHNLGNFAFRFKDFLAVSTLIACQRYGDPDDHDDDLKWYFPDKDVGQECRLAVLHGFMAVAKGFTDPPIPHIEVKDGVVKESESRCYLVGRMIKNDPLALRLAEELNERVARLRVILLGLDSGDKTSSLLPCICTADGLDLEDVWIERFRTAPTEEQLLSQPWTVEWSLHKILGTISYLNMLQYKNMTRDYYEFIIIDREPGRAFDLLNIVADALQKLNGDPPHSEVFRQAAQKYTPADEQDKYLKAFADSNFDPSAQIFPSQYIGSRVRCWNAIESFPNILEAAQRDRSSSICVVESRLISKIATDLESHGIIARVSDYEPSILPIVMRGADGYDDIYFRYELILPVGRSIPDFNPPRKNLLEFSKAYKQKHPGAVFAKGRINVHYCAWPLPPPAQIQNINFRTHEGRIYKWKALPFDFPMAPRFWQSAINRVINNRLPFACLVDTTLVVCAKDRESIGANLNALFDIGKEAGWKFSIPSPASWTTDYRQLGLGTLWEGVRPALAQVADGAVVR
ncbi:hypothetical protein TWF718_009035 [Orbilia javanica]|uniref:Uncharacterized protein n=1 Tax=Orbilia javanica TaxID=47235 RepID=A0AAN8MLE2_9PEZI